jgi:PAS domain S-box-containing protein
MAQADDLPVQGDTPPRSAGARWRFGYPFAILVLLASLGLVFSAWSGARQRELNLAESQFHGSVGRLASLVQLRLTSYDITLRGGASLFAALQWPSPQQWRSYTDGLALANRFPSLAGLGFAAYADPGQLERLQLLIHQTGYGRFTVYPRGVRAHYGPIVYLEPRTTDNIRALGFDMYSEPVRQAAMRAAMDSGQTRMSGRVQLIQDQGKPPLAGLLLYSPVYDTPLPPDNQAQRRLAMKGWVYAPFRVDTMVQTAIAPAKGTERMRVVDVTDAAQVVLYADPDIDAVNTFTHSLQLSFYGRRWRFDFFSGPEHAAAPQIAAINKLLAAGIGASLLLFALAWMLASTEARARRIAGDMTASYRRSEQRFRNAMHYSAIGKALLDSQGRIVESNPSFAVIVGRSPRELIGLPLSSLLDGSQDDPMRTSQMSMRLDGAGEVIRTTRSLHRQDGELRNVQLTFAPVPGDPGNDVVRLVQVDDITDRVRAESAVQALNRTLESRVAARTRELSEANRELESFAYSVSHDLRAPLRSIEGFSRILGERHAGALDDTGRDYLERVRKATSRMAELIDALLKLSRIGRSGLNVTDVDLSALAEEVGAGLADAEPGRRVELRVQPGMRARGDRSLLMTLLDNLMGNAWKFTRDCTDARIEFTCEADADGRVWFVVRDNGAGFDPDYANKLFKPFQRLHSQDEFPGHGVGLASVKRIIERHLGEIEGEGKPGQGATFRFMLGTAAGVCIDEAT